MRAATSDTAAVESAPTIARCPLCELVAVSFLPFGVIGEEPDRKCPACGSLERHRLVWLYFLNKTNIFRDRVRMLHVAPEPFFTRRLRWRDNIEYASIDLGRSGMARMNLEHLGFRSASFDVIYASHVLEHVDDDAAAMRELYSVLRPGGWAALLVPVWGPVTIEDPDVTDPDGRALRFGQSDHVRLYGHDGTFERRLEAAGFEVRADYYAQELPPADARRYRLRTNEEVFFCTKPGAGPP